MAMSSPLVHALHRMKEQIAEEQTDRTANEVLSKEEAMRRFMARKATNSGTSTLVNSQPLSRADSAEERTKRQQEDSRKRALAQKLIEQQAISGGKNSMVLQRFLERKGLKREASSGVDESSPPKRLQSCMAAC